MDKFTNKSIFDREFGHNVRVLVDIDLRKTHIYKMLVEMIGFAFLLALIMKTCLIIAHLATVLDII